MDQKIRSIEKLLFVPYQRHRHDGAVYPERTVNEPSSHQSGFHKDESEGTYDWILDEFACPPLRLRARLDLPENYEQIKTL